MEVSGSEAILLQSETGNVNQGPQQHTGFEPRAERQSLDTKCDMNRGLNRDSLNQVYREIVATNDGTSAAHTKVMDLGSGPLGLETQNSSDIEMRSVGLENHRFSPKSFHSSSEHVIVIDSVSSGQQVDRDFEWGQVGTSTTPQVNGSGNKQGVGGFNRNAPMIHPKSMRDNTTQLVSPRFRPSEKNTRRPGTGNSGEANKASWCSLAILHRHSEIPGRVVQQPFPASLPDGYFRPSATTFSHSSNFASHFRPGTVERPYGCPSCNKKFSHSSNLKRHQNTRLDAGNTGEANKASLRSLPSLHRHSEIPGRGAQQPAHTSLPVGHFRPSATTSSHSSNLANHIRPGTIERPYGCPSCHKKFVHESDLLQHVVIHTRKRVFACTLCEKSFVSPSKLQVHQNVHTGEKPFSCVITSSSCRTITDVMVGDKEECI
uniref:C2H2-type domain-containing protein n=1 Tax=Oncorhynchus tshawytscha TaxID=74940 RepID=A0AAZ3SVL0_ONCTS